MKRAVLFTGSREWKDPKAVLSAMNKYPQDSIMLHGAAAGLDLMADHYGRQRGWVVVGIPAIWQPEPGGKIDRAAGPKRNALLIDVLLMFRKHGYEISVEAFPLGGPGTADCCERAERAKVPVTTWKVTE